MRRFFLLILLICSISNLNAQVHISILGTQTGHTISPMIQGHGLIYCFEANSIYEDGRMAQLYKDVGAGYLRYPGGAVTTMYHWDDLSGQGWIDHWNGTYDRANDEDPANYMDLDEYMLLCNEAGVEPMLGINMSSGRNYNRQEDGLNEAVAMLKYCNEKNYQINYLYLDNENHHKKWPVEEYADQINYYADSLKKYAPDAKYIANWTDKFRTNIGSFTKLVNMAGDNFDYIDVHWYWKWTEGSWNEWIAKSPMENETEWYDGGTYVEEIAYFNDLMNQLGKPNIKLASMEWNLGPGTYRDDPTHNDFKTALMQSEMQMQMMQGGLEIASLWSTQWPDDEDGDFRFLVSSSNDYQPTPSAEFYKLYKNALNGVFVKSFSTNNKVLSTAVMQENNKLFLYVLNKNEEAIALDVDVNAYKIKSVEQAVSFIDPGIVENIFMEESDGTYIATIRGYSLSMFELSVEKSDTYVDAMDGRSTIEIWPNPASSEIQIIAHGLRGEAVLNVYNLTGSLALSRSFDNLQNTPLILPVYDLPEGIYLLSVKDATVKSFYSKFVVRTAGN